MARLPVLLWLAAGCRCPGGPCLVSGGASLELGQPPGCADPGARARRGPYERVSTGDWAAQPEGGPPNFAAWGLSVADVDGDGFLDIFLPSFDQDRLYMGREGPDWVDQTSTRWPVESTPSFGSAAADADGDGDLDLAVVRRGEVALYLNDGGGRFSRASALPGASGENVHAAWGVLDGDGLPELFIGSFYPDDEATLPDPNALFQNLGGGAFADISATLGDEALYTPANAGGFLDIDRDGDQDLYVVNDKPGAGFLSVLLENDSQGNLRYDEDARGLDLAIQGMGLGVGDLNDDGFDDLVITGWDEDALLLSDGAGGWYEAAEARGLRADPERVVGWGVELVDLDLDGDLDVVIVHGPDYDAAGNIGGERANPAVQRPGVYVNTDGTFQEESAEYGVDDRGVYRGLVVADLNRDGFPDLIARDIHARSPIWLSRCDDSAWLSIGGALPLGARVRVESGGRVQERTVVSGSTSIASSGPPELLFGLGDADTVDRLEVIRPDGSTSTFTGIPTRRPLTLR